MDKDELYIVLDNYGFPRWADNELTKLKIFLRKEEAEAVAREMAEKSPNTVISVWKLEARWVHDGLNAVKWPYAQAHI